MSLSFREQAAIALYSIPNTGHQESYGAHRSAALAQDLADACCEQWGHDVELPIPEGFARECNRCGEKVKP